MRLQTRMLLCLLSSWVAVVPCSHAAPVTDLSAPDFYAAPSAGELSDINTLLGSSPSFPAGSIFTGLRGAPTVQVNTGHDATAPGQVMEAQNMEVGTLPLPTLSHNCSPTTPVTVAISESTYLLSGQTYSPYGGFGIGTTLLDSRDLSFAAPVTIGLMSPAGPLDLGVPTVAPATSYVTTFAELAFFTLAITGFEVAETIMPVSSWEVAQASITVQQMPTISYQYDNVGCSAVAPPLPSTGEARPVPTLNPLGLMALCSVVMLAAGVALRRVRSVRQACHGGGARV